jgi:hypothetical protein
LLGRHSPIGHGCRAMPGEFARQRARRSLHRLSCGTKTLPSSQPTTQFFALYETQASVAVHVQLLRSWSDQDTGVALEP